jgi:hypothetical protein
VPNPHLAEIRESGPDRLKKETLDDFAQDPLYSRGVSSTSAFRTRFGEHSLRAK